MNRLIIGTICVLATTSVVAQSGRAPTQRNRVAGNSDAGNSDAGNLVVILPDRPLHVRLHVLDNGKSLEDVRKAYIENLIASLDVNRDGRVSREETRKSPLFNTKRRFDDNPFLKKLERDNSVSERDVVMTVQRAAGQPLSYRQDDSLADNDLGVFDVLDEDGSGMIEPREMRLAASRIADRDSDTDRCITFDEFVDQPEPDPNQLAVMDLDDTPPPSMLSERLRDFREPTLPTRLVRLYDANRDAKLSAKELGWSVARITALDTNQDGLLTSREIAAMRNQPADIALRIDLGEPTSTALELTDSLSGTEITQPREGLLRIVQGDVTITFGFRHRDPLAEAAETAQIVFNGIDFDGNGYLDRDEIEGRHRFERYLFDAMDVDQDDRVFAKEMMQYVRSFAEPAASSCQVTLYDVGSGYFQMIDLSDDGRISIRELRSAESALNEAAGGSGKTLNPSKVRRNYRIELTRGMVSLFGAVDRPSAEAPTAILRTPVGPSWFTANDTNDDGDLTWEEFIGPETSFRAMDTDKDGLIDASEAAAYESMLISKRNDQ